MALVFIDTKNLEAAVPIREAVLADRHDVLMIENEAELFMTGGLVDVNSLTNCAACMVRSGSGASATTT